MPPSEGEADPIDAHQVFRDLKAFARPEAQRSVRELVITVIPFILLCGATLIGLAAGHLWALALILPAGLFLLRLFLIQHDCGHGSFFPSRFANDWTGRALGVFTFTPYDCWKRSHALHHAGTGNLDARGFGDVDTLTVREFAARGFWGRLAYRAYRHPAVLLGVGPAYLFLLRHRLPIGLMRAGRIFWISALATNAFTALIISALAAQFGWVVIVTALLPVLLIAATTGVWLFYIQHQFEHTDWQPGAAWGFHEAALYGSSHLDLPPFMRWFTANIGIHHIHHLASRIPYYRLPEALAAYPRLNTLNCYRASETWGAFRLVLWDDNQRKLVPFGNASDNRSSA